jgi:hypothetical protein
MVVNCPMDIKVELVVNSYCDAVNIGLPSLCILECNHYLYIKQQLCVCVRRMYACNQMGRKLKVDLEATLLRGGQN